jgi:hypothetical protein
MRGKLLPVTLCHGSHVCAPLRFHRQVLGTLCLNYGAIAEPVKTALVDCVPPPPTPATVGLPPVAANAIAV